MSTTMKPRHNWPCRPDLAKDAVKPTDWKSATSAVLVTRNLNVRIRLHNILVQLVVFDHYDLREPPYLMQMRVETGC